MPDLNVPDLIIAKRDGGELPADVLRELVAGYTRGSVPDYQMSAFLMAAYLRGMSMTETLAMTEAMLHSGRRMDLSAIAGRKVGKHSTGGVGDKISLVLAPVVAACGVFVPKLSGRGLGFTGGTLDKLEAIPGFRTSLSAEAYRTQLAEIGLVIAGQTEEIAPADRALYALRDVTGTVDSIPLIASSIMSKKLAEGLDALVLDVKCGGGAFMKDEKPARSLAEMLVSIGERMGTPTVARMTRMDVPLGYASGNWPEVVEAVHGLQGADVPGVMEIVRVLAGDMIVLGERAAGAEEAQAMAQEAIDSGRAFDAFRRMVERQGGDASCLDQPERRSGFEPVGEVRAKHAGWVAAVDALTIGRTASAMGAGRKRKEDAVDPLAGIVLQKRPGDRVEEGATLARLFMQPTGDVEVFTAAVGGAFTVQKEAVRTPGTVLIDRFSDGAWERSP